MRACGGGWWPGLVRLGVVADVGGEGAVGARPNEAICYLQPAAHEICVGGRKLIGSAQLRRRGALLQHGSLPLGADIMAIADALVYENEAGGARQRRRNCGAAPVRWWRFWADRRRVGRKRRRQ